MIGTAELIGTMTHNPDLPPHDDDRFIETGEQGQQIFDSLPEIAAPTAQAEIFADNILPPSTDFEGESDRLRAARHHISWKLGLMAVGGNAMHAVVDCANEAITNAKRYAGGGRVAVSFIDGGDILVNVKGRDANPPEAPEQPTPEIPLDEFDSFSLEDLVELADPNLADDTSEEDAERTEEDAALAAILFGEAAEHGRGIKLMRARSKNIGRYRENPEAAWSVWFTIGDGARNAFKQLLAGEIQELPSGEGDEPREV